MFGLMRRGEPADGEIRGRYAPIEQIKGGWTLSESWRRSPRTVRPRSSGRVPVWLCLLAFCATAMVVYQRGRERWRPIRTLSRRTPRRRTLLNGRRKPRPAVAPSSGALTPTNGRGFIAKAKLASPFVFTADDPRQAAETANALADRYADQTSCPVAGRDRRAMPEGPASGRGSSAGL